MYCKCELDKSVLSMSPCLVPRLRWNCLLLASVCTVARCWPMLCEQLYVWFLDASFPQSRPHAAVLQSVGCCFVKSIAATQSGWPHSAALTELLEHESKVGR